MTVDQWCMHYVELGDRHWIARRIEVKEFSEGPEDWKALSFLPAKQSGLST